MAGEAVLAADVIALSSAGADGDAGAAGHTTEAEFMPLPVHEADLLVEVDDLFASGAVVASELFCCASGDQGIGMRDNWSTGDGGRETHCLCGLGLGGLSGLNNL